MNIATINPYIRTAIQSIIAANRQIKRRIIFDYELIYIEDGEFVLNYNEIDYICKKGDFIFLRPGVPHSFTGINCDLSQPHIHFDIAYAANSPHVPISFKDIDALSKEELGWIREDIFQKYPKTPFVFFTEQKQVLELFYEIVSVPGISALSRKAKLIQIIDKLISDNFPDVFGQNDTSYCIEKKVKDYIDAGQGMSSHLEDIAKQFNYSKYYLDHCFKTAYGKSLIAYRNEKRMLLAKEMLKTETVSSVSEALGFSSIYVFSRAFHNFFGFPPSYLKHNKDFKKR